MDNNTKVNILIESIKDECSKNYNNHEILHELEISIRRYIENKVSFVNEYMETLKKIEGVNIDIKGEIKKLVIKIEKEIISNTIPKDKILNRKFNK